MDWTKFVVMGTYDGARVHYFDSISDFLDHLFENYAGHDAFAHFGGSFDFLFVLECCLQRGDISVLNMIPRGSGLLSIDMIGPGGEEVTLRDSSALLPYSLATLTKSFGVDHKKQEWDHSKTTGDTPELREYLKYDLIGLYEVIEKFRAWPINQKAGPSYTIAGQAMRVLRTYLQLPIPALSQDLDAELRGAYLGGRTEIFKLAYKGKKPLYSYDVTSLYPSVMKVNTFPGDFSHETMEFEKGKHGFYHATATVPEMSVPPLGVVFEQKYIFPVGSFKGFWSACEIEYAKTLGCEFKIHHGYVFKNGGYIFREYIADLFEIRKNSPKDSVHSTICKLLMNASYGRFGIDLNKEQLVFDDGSEGLTPHDGDDEEPTYFFVGKKKFRLMKKDVMLENFSHVGIAAYVTSYARVAMHKLYMKAPDELYYTDTDSIYTTFDYPSGSDLGQLKKEAFNCDNERHQDGTEKHDPECYYSNDACFLLPKTYKAGKRIRMKGFDAKKIKHFRMDDFFACLEGDLKRLKITQEPKFAKLRTAIRMGVLVTKTKESSRQIRSMYDKRIVTKKGKYQYETEAIRFSH